MNFSVFFKLLTYMGDESIISAIAVPLALSRCPFAFFGLATGLTVKLTNFVNLYFCI